MNAGPTPGTALKSQNLPSSLVDKSVAGGPTDPEVAALSASQTDNATAALTNVLVQEIVKKNPEGPQEVNGKLTIATPDNLNQLISAYIKTHPFSLDPIKPTVSVKDVAVTDSSDQAAVNSYLSDLSGTVANLNSDYSQIDTSDPSAQIAGYNELLKKYNGELKNIKTPRPLAGLHQIVLSAFDVSEKYAALVNNDPITAAALEDAYDKQLTQLTADMDAQIKTLSETGFLTVEHKNLVQSIFGIHTAYAIGLGVPVNDQNSIWQQIKKFLYDKAKDIKAVLLEYLKNRLLKQMTLQVINWVAGGPQPQFVQNWNSFLGDATQGAMSSVFQSVAPQLCGSAGTIGSAVGLGGVADFVRKVMTPVQMNGYVTGIYPTCTLGQVINNVDDFQHDLRNGGWLAYTSLMQPQNTIFGNLMEISDRQSRAAAQAEKEALARATAGSGFPGQLVCDNGQPPLAQDETHNDGEGGTYTLPRGSCADYSTPHIPTPGVLAKDISAQAFTSAYNRLINTGDAKALTAFIAEAALSNLIKKGLQGLTGYAHQYASNVPASTDPGGVVTPAPLPPETPDSTAVGLAQQILAHKQTSLSNARGAADAIGQAMDSLESVVAVCSESLAGVAKANLQGMQSLRDTLTNAVTQLDSQVSALQDYVANADSAAPAGALPAEFGTLADARTEDSDIAAKYANAVNMNGNAVDLASCVNDVANQPPAGGE